ncbi:MAG: hypothetical protein RLZZ528_2134 [Pseudomonadota bacterium]
MLLSLRNTAIAAVSALSIAAIPAAPAHAWGKNEQNFLKGVLATVAVGALIASSRKQAQAQPTRSQPVHTQPAPTQPVRYQPQQPVYAPTIPSNIYSTPAAVAFKSYSTTQRLAIQRRLASLGYYRSGIDGQFGPGTFAAISAYARDHGQTDRLASVGQAFAVYDGLIY